MLVEDEQRLKEVEAALDSALAEHALLQEEDESATAVDSPQPGHPTTVQALLVGTAPLSEPVCAALLAVSTQFLKIAERPRARHADRRRFARLSLAHAFRATESVNAEANGPVQRGARSAVAKALKALGDYCGARDYLMMTTTMSGAGQEEPGSHAAVVAAAASVDDDTGESDREMLEELQTAMVDELRSMDKLQNPEEVAAQGLSTPVKEKVVKGLGPKRLAALRDAAADPDR